MPIPFRSIVTADWGATPAKRSAWVADVEARRLARLAGGPWSLATLIDAAALQPGPVLLAIDAVLGLPENYFDLARAQVPAWAGMSGFLDWLRLADATPGTFDPVATAADWTPAHPFFRVPKGRGSLKAYWTAASGPLFRAFEPNVGAKPMFAVSGIPGTVGSGTRALFIELGPLLANDGRTFGVWPFEGSLQAIAARRNVVVAEMYPRISYGLGVSATIPAPRLRIAKTKAPARAAYLARLRAADWVRAQHVDLGDCTRLEGDEDDFDAMVSAAALLRAALEGHAVVGNALSTIEGSMLALQLVA